MLVAVVIFGIISLLAYGGYNQLIAAERHRRAQREPHARGPVDRATHDRRLRDARAATDSRAARRIARARVALRHAVRKRSPISRARAGRIPPACSRSTLQRVTYRLENNKLERAYWNALDRTLTAEPTSAVLLDKVRTVSFRFMDQNQSWHEQWPPLGYSGAGCGAAAADRSRDHARSGRLGQAGAAGGGVGMSRNRHAHAQRGVALIMAVLIVALATMLAASVSFKGYLDQRRSANASRWTRGSKSRSAAKRGPRIRCVVTSSRARRPTTSPRNGPRRFRRSRSTGGEFEGQLEDMQGRFNLNSLVTLEGGQLKFDQTGDRSLRAAAGAARARDEVGEDHRRLDRHRHRSRISPMARKTRPTPASRRPIAPPTCR